ncbi:UNVERIFIED_CONTAM: hypothetical protein Sradi_1778000 [Sesamum radiatum]|uniref:Uncharacterized protein n=1 Tax=Sesamum radiatum TaxID=300843 RepID=A0AAW2TY53_SESRA
MYGEHPDKGMTEIESRDIDFLEEDFPSISEVKENLNYNELRDPQGGASITVEGETPNSYPVIDGDNESDPKLSGSCSLEEHNFKIHKCEEVNVEEYLAVDMRSKANPLCVLLWILMN